MTFNRFNAPCQDAGFVTAAVGVLNERPRLIWYYIIVCCTSALNVLHIFIVSLWLNMLLTVQQFALWKDTLDRGFIPLK